MAEVEIEATDVVRVVLQFLKENSLTRSLQVLQEESGVALNAVDSVDALVADVQQGRWEAVMGAVATLKLPAALLTDLYEQLVLELVEAREIDTARQILRSSEAMMDLKARDSARHARLEAIASKPYFDPRDGYAEGSNKERRRGAIAEGLRAEVSVVPPARLLALLGQSLKWQQHQGQLPVGQRFDLFAGAAAQRVVEPETFVSSAGPVIKFGKKSHAECAAFSPDGQYLVSGSMVRPRRRAQSLSRAPSPPCPPTRILAHPQPALAATATLPRRVHRTASSRCGTLRRARLARICPTRRRMSS